VTILRIISAVLIIAAAIYWLYKPDSNMEPIIIIIGALVGFIVSFKDLVLHKFKDANDSASSLPLSIRVSKKNIRCYTESVDYGIQINFDVFFSDKTLIKNLYLNYKEPCGFGEKWTQRAEIYIVKLNEDDLLVDGIDTCISRLKASDKLPVFPNIFLDKSLLQVTIGGYVAGERLPDGWEGVALSGWEVIVEFNEQDSLKLPLVLSPHFKSEKKAINWQYTGFVDVNE
jgi:hypothetical protein